MRIKYKNIILRDYCESDIADEIRWFNEERAWMTADTPWETAAPVDEEEFKKQMLGILSSVPFNALRSRLEIETKGKHIGFVCSYPLDGNSEGIFCDKSSFAAQNSCALGIEICESVFWGKGLGRQSLAVAILYYQDNGFKDFYLETWSGNERMLKCAERLGFYIFKIKTAFRQVNGKAYDALFLRLDDKKFKAYLNKIDD